MLVAKKEKKNGEIFFSCPMGDEDKIFTFLQRRERERKRENGFDQKERERKEGREARMAF